ncbi:MAG: DNA polymerase III subunit gamma/tau, partial [Proteobacteria bacterium]|nr:DNA polymerase III subunit gamma/tau [Pseudomonadota bacterium]
PPHAKFIFATTEIRKVPVTVLSRCQRFDLRRVDADVLIAHLANIAAKEGIEVEQGALALIARAAEGSVRDSLSLMDQAIAHAAGPVRAEDVRQMLGLADRIRVVDLFEALMKGDIAAALNELRAQYDIGADPAVVLSDLAEFAHFVTRMKVVPAVGEDVSLSEAERVRGRAFAQQLSLRVLSRAWQMLLKGIGEVQSSGRPVAAAEMVLVRIAYAADLPTPDEVVRSLAENGGGAPARGGGGGAGAAVAAPVASQGYAPRFEAPRGAPRAQVVASSPMPNGAPVVRRDEPEAIPAVAIASFADLIAFVADKRDINAKMALERDVRLVRFEDGKLEIALMSSAPKGLVHELQQKLSTWTGRRWIVVISKEEGDRT